MSIARKLTTNVVYAVGSRLVGAVFGLTTTAIMARHLGPDAFGVFRTAFAWAVLCCMAANLGLNVVCLREISQPGADIRRVVGAALGLRLLVGAACIVLSAGVAWFVPVGDAAGAAHLSVAAAVAAVGSVATLGNELVTTVFQQSLTQKRASLAEIGGGAATLALTAIAAGQDLGVVAFAAAASAGLVVTFVIAAILSERIAPIRPIIDLALSRRMVRSGVPLFVGDILGMVTVRLDTVLLSMLSVASEVGYYGIANKIREIAVKLPYLFAALLMPILTRAADQPGQFRRVLGDGLVAAWIFGVAVMLALACFADVIVSLLAGGKYAAAVDIVRLTGPALAAGCMSAVLQYAAYALDRSPAMVRAIAISSTIALVAMLLLIPRHGATGAAAAVVIGELVFMLGLIRPASPDGVGVVPWPRLAAVTATGAGVAALTFEMRAFGAHWAIAAATMIVAYPALLLLFRTVSLAQLRALTAKS